MARVCLVTGSNKGIGYGIVRNLAPIFDGTILLTSRKEELGQEALDKLKTELKPDAFAKIKYEQLDITDEASIQRLKKTLQDKYGGLDVLINNAGIAYKNDSTAPFSEQALVTNKTNYFGTKQVSQALFPLLRPDGRVVNVCSQMGLITGKGYSDAIVAALKAPDLTTEKLDHIVNEFIKYAAEGTHVANGYRDSSYGVSKAAAIALTFIQARENKTPGVLINGCCPGYVDTDMTSHKGPKTIDQGADTPIYLATLPKGATEPHGKFYYERKEMPW